MVQIIHLLDDEAPVFTNFPADAAYQCLTDVTESAFPTGEDNCDDEPVIAYLGEESEGTCPTTITRTWSITDHCNNSTEMTQTIVVNDTMAPEFTSFPANASLECGDALPTDAPTAEDNCTEKCIDHFI